MSALYLNPGFFTRHLFPFLLYSDMDMMNMHFGLSRLRYLENYVDNVFMRSWPDHSLFLRQRDIEDYLDRVDEFLNPQLRGVPFQSGPTLIFQARNRGRHRQREGHSHNPNNRQRTTIHFTLQSPSQCEPSPTSNDSVDVAECTPSSSDIEICAICREQFKEKDDIRQLPCEHLFHPSCLRPWLQRKNTCPTCRQHLN